MKILIFSSNSSSEGGGEQYLVSLGKGLKALGQEVVVLLSTKDYMDAWEKRLRAENIVVRRENLIGLRNRPLRVFQSAMAKKQIKAIASICEEISPDIIHINQQYDSDGLDYVMGALAYGNVPVVGTIHMPMAITEHPRKKNDIRTWVIKILFLDEAKRIFLKRWYKKYSYTKIFVSEEMKNEFAAVYEYDMKLHVILLGVDVDNIPYSLEDRKSNIIGFCGRFDPQKDLFLLINSWLNSRQKGLDSNLLLIGDGILRKDIEMYLENRVSKNFWRITGWVGNPQDYIKELGLLMLTSIFESWGLVIVEASCMGKPCVCTNFPVAHEIKEKIPFLKVINSQDPDVLGDAIIEVFRKDPPLKEEVVKVRSYFSCIRMAQDTLNVYKGLLKK